MKKFADLYLTYRYGPGLTVEDTLDLFQLMQHFTLQKPKDHSWSRSAMTRTMSVGTVTRSSEYHYKVAYRRSSNELLALVSDIQSVGLLPTPKTIWELIPYSFCVDWFTDVSSRLEVEDAKITWETHNVLGTVKSVRHVYGGFALELLGIKGYVGDLSFVDYSRWTGTVMDSPSYFEDAPQEFHNLAELTALIISRKAR